MGMQLNCNTWDVSPTRFGDEGGIVCARTLTELIASLGASTKNLLDTSFDQ